MISIITNGLKGLGINLLIVLCSILVFCLAGELFCRIFWDSGYHHPYDWRDRTEGYLTEKSKDTFRIIILGDSNAYGQGVRREETFSKLLENHLNDLYANKCSKQIEIVNLAWPGLNTAQEYINFLNKGLMYNPDMLLIAYNLNDLGGYKDRTVNPTSKFYIRRPKNKGRWKLPVPKPIDDFLTIKSDFYLFLLGRYDSLLYKTGIRKRVDPDEELIKAYSENNKDWLLTQQSLGLINKTCKQRNMPSILVIFPHFHELEKYRLGELHKKVRFVAESIGLPVLDLLPAFIGKKSKDYIVSRVDTHPNAVAHKAVAEEVFKFLRRKDMVSVGSCK